MKRILSLMVIFVLLLAGCSGGGAKDDVVHLRFAPNAKQETLDTLQGLVDKYNEKNPKVQVSMESIPGTDFDQKMTAAMGAGDAPDIMMMWNYPMFKDGLQPLDSFIDKDQNFDINSMYKTPLQYSTLDGKVYGLPMGFTTRVIYYNKDIFDKAGLEYPKSGWTLDDYYQTAKTIKEKTDNPGIVFQVKEAGYQFESYLWNSGVSWMKGDKVVPNQPEVVKLYTDWQNLVKDKVAITSDEKDDGRNSFATGQVGMFDSGTWPKDTFDKAGLNYGVVELPVGTNMDPVSIVHSSSFAMSKNTKYPEESWDFIKFLASEEGAQSRIKTELPVYETVAQKNGLLDDDDYSVFYNEAKNSADYQTSSFKIQDWPKFEKDIAKASEQILSPEMLEDPQTVLDGLEDSYE